MSNSLTAIGRAYISGKWVDPQIDQAFFESLNPATSESVWSGYEADKETVDMAVEQALLAFKSWRSLSLDARAEFIARFTEIVKENAHFLAETIHLETGKPFWEAKTEVASMVGKFAISQKAYEERTGDSVEVLSEFSTRLTHRPIGVFAVLGPYNFPGHLPNGHIIPALLAGNTIVFKPSEQTPMVGEQLVRYWHEAGLPAGVLNLVQGGRETGEHLVANSRLNGILFTGSALAGKAIHAKLAGQPEKMLALELGGNNPLVVDQVADTRAAVYTILQSAFLSAGQRCTCARRLILVDTESNRRIVEQLIEASRRIKVGVDDQCFIGPVISLGAAEKLLIQQQQLLDTGARTLLPMRQLKEGLPFLSPGIVDVTPSRNQIDEECFGPLLQIQWVESLNQAIEYANDTSFGLSAGLLSDSNDAWQQFYQNSNAGIVNWNRPLTGASGKAPFGGSGCSGNYRPSAYYAADYCAYPVASLLQNSVQLPEHLSPGISL